MNKSLNPAHRVTRAAGWRLGALLLLGSTVQAGQAAPAELVNIEWADTGRFERTLTVAPAKFAEVCGKLREGQTVKWSFDTPEAMNFNIHYHAGKDVVYPARQNKVRQLQGELAVTTTQDYCWMWANKSPKAAQLRLTLSRQ